MSRFEESNTDCYDVLKKLIGNHFPSLAGARFQIIFDTKKRKSDGKYVFGRIQATNDLLKYFTADNVEPEGVDFIIYIDKEVWTKADELDKQRLIYHELLHTDVDLDKKNPYSTRGHEIEGFFQEATFLDGDPKWGQRLAIIAESVYEAD